MALLFIINFSLVHLVASEIDGSRMKYFDLIPNATLRFLENSPEISNTSFLSSQGIVPNFALEMLIRLIYTRMNQLLLYVDEIDIVEDVLNHLAQSASKSYAAYCMHAFKHVPAITCKCNAILVQLHFHLDVAKNLMECIFRIFIDKELRNHNTTDACKFSGYSLDNPSFDVCLPSSCDHYNTLMMLSRSRNWFNLTILLLYVL
ncbi:hypothetical protein LOAG_03734 [Loa loa]|uniref:Uncharacterized protein n=1 Tax=Loa loa TaxID=7209 RepID=A0A1S0U3Q6_LOALO|nr:hypothetical protein LOAG_03734 [Loa loa]EFO24751.1 hypothetical protein LOAG_03734 [Loa loa]